MLVSALFSEVILPPPKSRDDLRHGEDQFARELLPTERSHESFSALTGRLREIYSLCVTLFHDTEKQVITTDIYTLGSDLAVAARPRKDGAAQPLT